MTSIRPVVCVESGDCYLDKVPDDVVNQVGGSKDFLKPSDYLVPIIIDQQKQDIKQDSPIKKTLTINLDGTKNKPKKSKLSKTKVYPFSEIYPTTNWQIGRGPSNILQDQTNYLVPLSTTGNIKKPKQKSKKIVGKGLKASLKKISKKSISKKSKSKKSVTSKKKKSTKKTKKK